MWRPRGARRSALTFEARVRLQVVEARQAIVGKVESRHGRVFEEEVRAREPPPVPVERSSSSRRRRAVAAERCGRECARARALSVRMRGAGERRRAGSPRCDELARGRARRGCGKRRRNAHRIAAAPRVAASRSHTLALLSAPGGHDGQESRYSNTANSGFKAM